MSDDVALDEVEFLGKRFPIAERVSTMALMRFAKVASAGVDVDDMEGLAAMYDLLEQCIEPVAWQAFQAQADAERAQAEDLLAVVMEALTRVTDRPTSRPSDSSDGPQIMSESSPGGSSSPVVARLERIGRPDLALMVTQAERERASRASA